MASMRLTFVGTGVSCAVPVIGHVDLDTLSAHEPTTTTSSASPPSTPLCSCTDAVLHPDGPNRRNNASLLISLFSAAAPSSAASSGEADVEEAHVLIDAGKTFRDAYFRVLAPLRVPRVDVLVLTHGHADAMHCVEEVCGWQTARRQQNRDVSSRAASSQRWLPTLLTRKTLGEVESVSAELVQRSRWVHTTGQKSPLSPAQKDKTEKPRVAEEEKEREKEKENEEEDMYTALAMYELCESTIERIRLGRLLPLSPTTIPTAALGKSPLVSMCTISDVGANDGEPDVMPFFSFPVEHGAGYMSMCFVFGHGVAFRSLRGASLDKDDKAMAEKTCVVYISDVSAIPAASMQFLQDLVKIDVLVFDLLAEKGSHSPSHTCWDDVMPYIRALTPHKTYCVGMFCSLEHTEANLEWEKDLREEKRKVSALLEQPDTATTTLGNCDRARCEAFLSRVESIELAYDGLQLVLPL